MTGLPAERNGMTKEHSDQMHALAEAIGGFAVTAYDIGGCTKGVWWVQHYRDDEARSCRCDELEAALAEYAIEMAAWAKDPAKHRHQLMAAELEVRYCGGEPE